ncbi:hypothetical protein [Treponema pectinovorum]|uniref:hypothetical protein n=1 Tax=Treponema pectinovorum TaxID=164 RepID=UPI0011C91F15|nr:hypothetical protein [Treponema pectinovorum]
MKKIIYIFIFSLVLNHFNAFAQSQKALIDFVKGSIQDKTQAVRQADKDIATVLAKKGIDFVLENQTILKNDRDLSALAVASVLKIPNDENQLKNDFPNVNEKLLSLFTSLQDENVRISILEKLSFTAVLQQGDEKNIVDFLNKSLIDYAKKDEKSPVIAKIINSLAINGNSDSYDLIYSLWKNKTYPAFNMELETALLKLSVTNKSQVVKVISTSNLQEVKQYFDLVKDNQNISKDFKAEFAENALSMAINTSEDISSKEKIELQLDCIQAIADAPWSRATALVVNFFSKAKGEYEKKQISDKQFIQIIDCITRLASIDSSKALSSYLAELNTNAEKNVLPAKNVILAVIKSLGVLGDKNAFDNLLYVTYLNYDEEIKGSARDSLAKLKW